MVKDSITSRKKRWLWATAVSFSALVTVFLFSLFIGAKEISFLKLVDVIRIGRGSTEYTILVDLRLPRILMGFAVGGGLSLSGVLLQALFRNPLVEPYTLGISGGATLGVAFNILFGLSKTAGLASMPLCGFLGAALVGGAIYRTCVGKGPFNTNSLLLIGVMVSYISSSLLMLIESLVTTEDLHGIVFWIMGSLEEPDQRLIWTALVVSVCGLIASYWVCIDLNGLMLGEEEAARLGISVKRTQKLSFLVASLITGVSVSLTGAIGFVGLLVPHVIRLLVGGDHRILLISSYLCGAAFLIFCDTVARTIAAPVELPVGVITGIMGGIFLVLAILKRGQLWQI
jgi:iron complex transport system permease protein